MKPISTSLLTKAALAMALATGGTALHAQDTSAPPPPPEAPVPDEQAPPPPAPGEPTDPLPPISEPVDEDGDGIDDITGEPIPEDREI